MPMPERSNALRKRASASLRRLRGLALLVDVLAHEVDELRLAVDDEAEQEPAAPVPRRPSRTSIAARVARAGDELGPAGRRAPRGPRGAAARARSAPARSPTVAPPTRVKAGFAPTRRPSKPTAAAMSVVSSRKRSLSALVVAGPGMPVEGATPRSSARCRANFELQVAEGGQDGLDDLRLVRERDLLERLGVGHRHVGAGHAADRRVEIVERLLLDERGEVRARRRRAASPPRRSRSGSSCARTRGSCRGRAGAACAGRSPRPRPRAPRRAPRPPSRRSAPCARCRRSSRPRPRGGSRPGRSRRGGRSSSGTSPRWP